MLSDEEKKAVEKLDYIQDFIIENGQYNADVNDMEYFSKVLNLIKKQSKEIEELKVHQIIFTNDYKPIGSKGRKFISKDKIKAKIEEIKEEKRHYLEINDEYNAQICDCIIEEYESLLEKE